MAKQQELGKFTVHTKLDPSNNADIIEAFEAEVHDFNTAKILTFHHLRNLAMAGRPFDDTEKSRWNTWLQNEFHITKRTANSIIYEAKTIWEMNLAALESSLEADRIKQKSIEKEIKDLEKKKAAKIEILTGLKPLYKRKKETDEHYQDRTQKRFEKISSEQRNLRRKLSSRKKALDRINARIQKNEEVLETKNLRVCFGTKKLQSKDPEAFRAQRDSQISFIGSSDESCQNQLFRLSWSRSRNQFEIRMRKDFYEKPDITEERVIRHKAVKEKPAWTEKKTIRRKAKEGTAAWDEEIVIEHPAVPAREAWTEIKIEHKQEPDEQKYLKGRVHFNYGASQIRWCLLNRTGPLSYRIIRKDGEYYLYCTFDWHKEAAEKKYPALNEELKEDQMVQNVLEEVRCRKPVALGVDINKGFLSNSFMNSQGGLIKTFDLNYRFSQGTKSMNDLSFLISRIIYMALFLDIPIVIEDINLTAKKYRARRKGNKAINRMLHSFAYRYYKKRMEEACFRYGVQLIKVNPAWTSEIAKQKYCIPMKLCVHNGAAWVIVRRGMGFKDVYHKNEKPKIKKKTEKHKNKPAEKPDPKWAINSQEPTF